MRGTINILLFVLINTISIQARAKNEQTYWGFVMDHAPFGDESGELSILKNLEVYEEQLSLVYNDEFVDPGPDIFVLPEKGLTGLVPLNESDYSVVPSPDENAIPCTNETFDWLIGRLSCAARNFEVYIVVNVPEQAPCEPTDKCPERGRWHFSTNVVFDRKGAVIAKYRKAHLIEGIDQDTDAPAEPEVTIFDTDFGVKFLLLAGEDMLYPNAALQESRKNFTGIVMPFATRWTLPSLTALQFQHGWVAAEFVTLLAAGYNNPRESCTGSGIYEYDGFGGMSFNEYALEGYPSWFGMMISKLKNSKTPRFISNSPHKPIIRTRNGEDYIYRNVNTRQEHHQSAAKELNTLVLRSESLESYETLLIPLTEATGILEGTISGCSVRANYSKVDDNETYYYRMATLNGIKGLEICILVFCNGSNVSDCAIRPDWGERYINMTEIELSGSFALDEYRDLLIPTSLVSDFGLFPVSGHVFFQRQQDGNFTRVDMGYYNNAEQLLTYGVYGKSFSTTSD